MSALSIPTRNIVNLVLLLEAVREWGENTRQNDPALLYLTNTLQPFGLKAVESEVIDLHKFQGFTLERLGGDEVIFGQVKMEIDSGILSAEGILWLDPEGILPAQITYRYDEAHDLTVELFADTEFSYANLSKITALIADIIRIHHS